MVEVCVRFEETRWRTWLLALRVGTMFCFGFITTALFLHKLKGRWQFYPFELHVTIVHYMCSWRGKCVNVPQTSAVKNPCVALHILVRCSFSWLRSVIHCDHRKPVTAHAQGERKTEKRLCREKGLKLPEHNIEHFTTVKQPLQFSLFKVTHFHYTIVYFSKWSEKLILNIIKLNQLQIQEKVSRFTENSIAVKINK